MLLSYNRILKSIKFLSALQNQLHNLNYSSSSSCQVLTDSPVCKNVQHVSQLNLAKIASNRSLKIDKIYDLDENQIEYSNYGVGSEELILLVTQLLKLKDSDKAIGILRKEKNLMKMSPDAILRNYEYLVRDFGLTPERAAKMPFLLSVSKEVVAVRSREIMTILKIHESEASLSFLPLSPRRLHQIASTWFSPSEMRLNETPTITFNSRLEHLSSLLNCRQVEVSDMMWRVQGIASSPLHKLLHKTHLLLSNGVKSIDLVKDPFIFLFNSDLIQSRLSLCSSSGLSIIKPWMLRCTEGAYSSYVRRLTEEQELLDGHKDTASFLAKSLGCSLGSTREILLRVPSVRRASATKLNDMITFLYRKGFTGDHILETPRILGHSVETVEKRIEELASFGYIPKSLFVFCQTSKEYSGLLRKLGKDKESNTLSDDELVTN